MSPSRPADLTEIDQPHDPRREVIVLERRLRDGEEKVRRAKEDGDWSAADRWETAWIGLLHQYESLLDRLDARPDDAVSYTGGGFSA